jgi:fluoride exporter
MARQDPLTAAPAPRLGWSLGALSAIAIGGALGTVARYLLETTFTTASGHFPATTLVINLSGSLAIGFLIPLTEWLSPRAPLARPFVVVGLLGGWTTYSTLAVDAVLLGKQHHVALSIGYLAATLIGGIGLVALGHAASRKVFPA